MFAHLDQKATLWKMTFSQEKNIITFLIVMLLFYILNASMAVFVRISYMENIFDIIALYTKGFYQTVGALGFTLTIIVSLLTAFLFTLLLFRATVTKSGMNKKLSVLGYLGLFFGFFVSGCPTCGLGLLAIFGLGASVLALPFGGKEISVIAIIVLVWIINAISNKILFCEVANVQTSKKKK